MVARRFSPRTHDFYVMGVHEPASYATVEVKPYQPGTPVAGQIMGGKLNFIMDRQRHAGAVRNTVRRQCRYRQADWQYKITPADGGWRAGHGQRSDLFGEMDGHLSAFNARTGQKLWSFNLGVAVGAPPITYRVNNVQYVRGGGGWPSANGWPRLMDGFAGLRSAT